MHLHRTLTLLLLLSLACSAAAQPLRGVTVVIDHFDSTSPEVGGVKFYYPNRKDADTGFVKHLEETVRRARLGRVDLFSGEEIGLSEKGEYAVLNRSLNPDTYLIELGNILSLDDKGENPDLRRMLDPEVRDTFAQVIADAVVRHRRELDPPKKASPATPKPVRSLQAPPEPEGPNTVVSPGGAEMLLMLLLVALLFLRPAVRRG